MNGQYAVPGQHVYDGTIYSRFYEKEILDRIYSGRMQLREDDIVIATYPKSGTSWMQTIVWLIYNGAHEKIEKHIYDLVPLLELTPIGRQPELVTLEEMSSPRIIKTHLPPKAFYSHANVMAKRTRIIYGMRNPKDVLVSYYHHHRMHGYFGNYPGTWDDFFELFKQDSLSFGNWFDHVLSWWNNRSKFHILFLMFEDIMKDPRGSIKRIANFLGKSLSDDAISNIVQAASFSNMRETWAQNAASDPQGNSDISPHLRRGCVGNWKEYFTQEQSAYIDDMYTTCMSSTGLSFDFGI